MLKISKINTFKDLTAVMQTQSCVNLVLVMNLKRSFDVFDDEDIENRS